MLKIQVLMSDPVCGILLFFLPWDFIYPEAEPQQVHNSENPTKACCDLAIIPLPSGFLAKPWAFGRCNQLRPTRSKCQWFSNHDLDTQKHFNPKNPPAQKDRIESKVPLVHHPKSWRAKHINIPWPTWPHGPTCRVRYQEHFLPRFCDVLRPPHGIESATAICHYVGCFPYMAPGHCAKTRHFWMGFIS